MHPVDAAILEDRLTADMLAEHARRPLPPSGESYWGDAMRDVQGDGHAAARLAASQMGSALASLRAVR